jgi:hypothetical protein
MEEKNKLVRSNKLRIIVSSLIIASVLVVFIDVLFPLTEMQRMVLRIFDLVVVVILGLDFVVRLKYLKINQVYLETFIRVSCHDPLVCNGDSRRLILVVLHQANSPP